MVEFVPGDLDRDGNMDIVGAGGGAAHVLIGKGDGTFSDHVAYGTAGAINTIKLADMNGDGILDIVAGGGNLAVFSGRGDGTFREPQKFAVGLATVRTVDVGDLDGDGSPDVIAGHTGTGAARNYFTVLIQRPPAPGQAATR